MDAQQTEIRAFLAAHHPFALLPDDVLTDLSGRVEIRDVPQGTVLMKPGGRVEALHIVRSGAIETRDPDGQLLARPSEGDCFGVRSILRGGEALNHSVALEDCRLYRLPLELFNELRRDHPAFAYHFDAFVGGRLRDTFDSSPSARKLDFFSERIGSLLKRGPVTLPADATIHTAARTMREEKVSCLMVTRDDRLVGIVTDRDLRNRVVAEKLAYDQPVESVMTRDPYCLKPSDYALDALILISRHNIHHLPVVEESAIVGCLTGSVLIERHTRSPLFLARSIHDCNAPEQLKEAIGRVPGLVHQMVEAGSTAQTVGHFVSSFTDAITVRLLELGEQKFGPPPVPYVWMAAGSQARREQTALSDQDNCMILDDSYDEREHGAYFRDLSRYVCTGLDTCGYMFCPGEIMAMTDKWRQPLSVWRRYFAKWIEEPEPMALMLSSVFFDLQPIRGRAALFEELRAEILEKTKKNRIFQVYMATNAMTHDPPIGFFRNFVLIRGGEHHQMLDLKHRGVVPIIDMARVHALAIGAPQVNTYERLTAAGAGKALSPKGMTDLLDALEFISMTRLRHQARMISEGKRADNFLSPSELSSSERSHLKSAFLAVKTMQSAMASRYQVGHF